MIKGYKIRIYPTKEQEIKIWKHIGACRFVWNYMLDLQIKTHRDGGRMISGFDMIRLLKPLRNQQEYSWLKDISLKSLQTVCTDLSRDYLEFFKRGYGFPKYKSKKKSRNVYPVRCDSNFRIIDGCPIVEKLGSVKMKTDFELPDGRAYKFSNVRISFNDGKYYISFGVEHENQVHELTDKSMGIDLGIKELAVVAYGDEKFVFHNINKSKTVRDLTKRIKMVQRSLSRKYLASYKRTGRYEKTKNIEKEIKKLRRLKARRSNIRLNYLHQTTHYLVTMLPRQVVMEELNVSGMMRNKKISRSLREQCLYEFIRQMRYKCEWNNIPFIQADRFFPSSKMCSGCGCIDSNLKLSDRIYVCNDCGLVIDRDYNAAINLMRYEA